jgi:uncharacterized protein (TIGR02300 family)
MAKPEWGTKRMCQSCGARFYDFSRSPITCPACGAVFDIEVATRTRRSRTAARPEPDEAEDVVVADREAVADETAVDEADEGDEEEAEVEDAEPVIEDASDDEDEEEDSHLIEDTGELGDDEDVSDVVDDDLDEDPDAPR